jgi:predicted branched-subunit amino acid permease
MSPEGRAGFLAGVKEVSPQFVGTVPFGLVTGVASVASGLSPWEAIGLSLLVFSGVAQLAVVQLLAVNAPATVILLATAVISLRLIMYSASIAPHFAHLPRPTRWLLSWHLTDQAFAMTSAYAAGATASQRAHLHYYYWGGAIPMFGVWHSGSGSPRWESDTCQLVARLRDHPFVHCADQARRPVAR